MPATTPEPGTTPEPLTPEEIASIKAADGDSKPNPGLMSPIEPERKKPRPKKGPRYELPQLGQVIRIEADEVLGMAFNCAPSTECAAIVTCRFPDLLMFKAHVFSPTTNPDKSNVAYFIPHEEDEEPPLWRP